MLDKFLCYYCYEIHIMYNSNIISSAIIFFCRSFNLTLDAKMYISFIDRVGLSCLWHSTSISFTLAR